MPEDKAMEEPKEVLNTASQIKINRPAYLRRWNERFRTREAQYRASKSSQSMEWLNYSSLHYAERSYKWDYISDHLTGAVLDEDRIERYLLQRSQGESQDYYAERAELAAYTPDFARACIVLGGKVFESETGVNRTWTRPVVDAEGNETAQDISLGDPADMASPVHTFWQNVDGNGSHYDSFLKSLAINLVAYGEMWVMLQGWDGDNAPCLRLIEPQYVLKDCYDKNGLLESVKVRSFFDAGSSGQDVKSKAEERFTIFYADYYQVWRYNDKGKPEQVGKDTAYSESGFAYEDKQGNSVPPIFKVKMPYETCIGYLLARKANVLFNHQNSLDMLLHVSCFPKLAADTISNGGEINKKKMRDIEDAILSGSTIIHGKGSQYIAPPMDPAKVKHEIIKEYRREFYRTAFQTYNDHAAQKTATEMRQDWSMSVQSFLVVVCVRHGRRGQLHPAPP